ncbi:MAG: hypothetical protein GXP46_06825 [Deferribacteres bacterium]|nr:hypothetical protein [Deferribacteres bacterium]
MKVNILLIVVSAVFLTAVHAGASGFGIGVHSGYGSIIYEENTTAFGNDITSEAVLDTVLFGISAEYTFTEPGYLFAGIVTDWAFGLEDSETWETDGVATQTNDLEVFGQFYDIRFGYKNTVAGLYYRIYASGGWDGIHFRRDEFVSRGVAVSGDVTEDFSLWRIGAGAAIGYKFGKWALDGRAAYAHYPDAEVKNSSVPDVKFDTSGTCLDMGFGLARELSANMSLYLGGTYTEIRLRESDIKQKGLLQAVFPDSSTRLTAGVVNLTYAF